MRSGENKLQANDCSTAQPLDVIISIRAVPYQRHVGIFLRIRSGSSNKGVFKVKLTGVYTLKARCRCLRVKDAAILKDVVRILFAFCKEKEREREIYQNGALASKQVTSHTSLC